MQTDNVEAQGIQDSLARLKSITDVLLNVEDYQYESRDENKSFSCEEKSLDQIYKKSLKRSINVCPDFQLLIRRLLIF